MGEGPSGPELADCEAWRGSKMKNVVLKRKDLAVELLKKRAVRR